LCVNVLIFEYVYAHVYIRVFIRVLKCMWSVCLA